MSGLYLADNLFQPEPEGKLRPPAVHLSRSNGREVCRDDRHATDALPAAMRGNRPALVTHDLKAVTCTVCWRILEKTLHQQIAVLGWRPRCASCDCVLTSHSGPSVTHEACEDVIKGVTRYLCLTCYRKRHEAEVEAAKAAKAAGTEVARKARIAKLVAAREKVTP